MNWRTPHLECGALAPLWRGSFSSPPNDDTATRWFTDWLCASSRRVSRSIDNQIGEILARPSVGAIHELPRPVNCRPDQHQSKGFLFLNTHHARRTAPAGSDQNHRTRQRDESPHSKSNAMRSVAPHMGDMKSGVPPQTEFRYNMQFTIPWGNRAIVQGTHSPAVPLAGDLSVQNAEKPWTCADRVSGDAVFRR